MIGEGLTDKEANFIRLHILEVQKQAEEASDQAALLKDTLDPLGDYWAVLVISGEVDA